MLYRVSFEESHNYNTTDRLYRSTVVEAPAYQVTGEGNIILPAVLLYWSQTTWAAQFGLTGELKFTHYVPTCLTAADTIRHAAETQLHVIQI